MHRHGWLCGTPGIIPGVGLQQTFRGGMWGGDGFVLQKLEGQGTAWIELSGELTTYQLPPGQTLLVHPGHVGMFQGSVQFTITRMPGIANVFFGGDGFHLVALTGPGQVWLQSMPLAVLAQALSPYLTQNGGTAQSAGAPRLRSSSGIRAVPAPRDGTCRRPGRAFVVPEREPAHAGNACRKSGTEFPRKLLASAAISTPTAVMTTSAPPRGDGRRCGGDIDDHARQGIGPRGHRAHRGGLGDRAEGAAAGRRSDHAGGCRPRG